MRDKRGLVLVALVFVLASTCIAAEQRIASVAVSGVSGSQLTEAQRAVHVRAGDVYSQKALQDDVTSLLGLQFVLSARAKENVTPAGVEVVYDVALKGRLTGIKFAGNRAFKTTKLLDIGDLKTMKYYDLAALSEARNLIIEKYKQDGYLFAHADFASQNDGSVLFTIEEGARLKVAKINIIGNAAFSDAVIKKDKVKTTTHRWLILPYRLDEDVVEEDRGRIQDFYRDAGYLDATVAVKFNLTSNGKGIIVDYMIAEGELYTVRHVAIEGATIVPVAQLTAVLKMTVGKPFSAALADKDITAMKAVYGHIGYIDAAFSARPVFEEKGNSVDLTYAVTEGTPVAIHEVEILGNDRIRDNVIRRDLEFHPGEQYDTDKIEESKKNLNKLGYFTSVEITPDAKAKGEPSRDAMVNVEETNTGSFLIGAGISSNQGLVGQVALTQRDFDYSTPPSSWRDVSDGKAWSGGGQFFDLTAAPGTKMTQLSTDWRNPRVDDSEYSLGLGAHFWTRFWETYDERRLGGNVSVGRQFTKHAFGEITANVDQVKISSVEADDPADVHEVKGSHIDNTLGLTLGHDTRDSNLVPTNGHLVSGTYETADKFLGSAFEWQRWRAQGEWYRLLRKDELDRPHVLMLRSRLAYMTTFTDNHLTNRIPIYDRLYVGGAGDLRGFAYRGLAPRVFHTPLGGTLAMTGTLEYDYPLAGDILRGDIFYDAGILAQKPGDFSLGGFRHSVGFGIKITIPPPLNFPIAIDFGIPIKKKRGDDTQLISFNIGTFY